MISGAFRIWKLTGSKHFLPARCYTRTWMSSFRGWKGLIDLTVKHTNLQQLTALWTMGAAKISRRHDDRKGSLCLQGIRTLAASRVRDEPSGM